MPDKFIVNDNMICAPASEEQSKEVVVEKGPNIKSFPLADELPSSLKASVAIKVGDNITTDHIMPAGARILPFRSNIPYISKFCFEVIDSNFAERASKNENNIIIAGENYGQGSSREHAALVPLFLGVRIVIAKSFARIHRANLINVGILPLTFYYEKDYDAISVGDEIVFNYLKDELQNGKNIICLNKTKGFEFKINNTLDVGQVKIIIAGGRLQYIKQTQLKFS